MSGGYAVVVFEEEEVGVVPHKWLVDNAASFTKCFWPPYKDSSRLTKAIRTMSDPQDTWAKYSVRVLAKCGE